MMVTVSFKKNMTGGILAGFIVDERMNFVDFSRAVEWADIVTKALNVPYTISDLRVAQ